MTDADVGTGSDRFLVTGACGCIGAWVIRRLLSERQHVVALDMSEDLHRLALVLSERELSQLTRVQADITRLGELERVFDRHAITNVIHLAALQVPFCRADPSLGAHVNVVGTINVFEASRRAGHVAPIVYASSIAAYDDVEPGSAATAASTSATGGIPGTLYGVFKRANEGAAAVYWRDYELASVGLRPHTVYGLGRDQGMTSTPTAAMLAAAVGQSYEISFGGSLQLQYAPDVADAFIRASRSGARSATVHNLSGRTVHMSQVVSAIEAVRPDSTGQITFTGDPLPFPAEVDHGSLVAVIGEPSETPLQNGVRETIARFEELIAAGRLSPPIPVSAGGGDPRV